VTAPIAQTGEGAARGAGAAPFPSPCEGARSAPVPAEPGAMGEGNQIRAALDESARGSRAAENKVSARLWLMTAGQAVPSN